MKKIYLLLAFILPITLQSCLKDEKNLFAESASDRLNNALVEYKELLSSSDNGWIMHYYAEKNQSYGGYNLLLQFTDDQVVAYGEISGSASSNDTSLYKVTNDDGAVLTFDTYNEIIHYFATPSANNPDALQGDYEFKFIGKSDDRKTIYLKGKKSSNYFSLSKLDESPESYLTKVLTMSDNFSAPSYEIEINGVLASCSVSNHTISFSYAGDDESIVTERLSFCFTPTGFDLYEPKMIGGSEISSFLYNSDSEIFKSTTGNVVIKRVIPPISEQLLIGKWYFAFSEMGSFGKTYWDYTKLNGLDPIGEELEYAYLGPASDGSFAFNFSSSGYTGSLIYDATIVSENQITLQFALSGLGNGVWYYNNAKFNYLINPISLSTARTFTITADDYKSPTWVKIVEDANPTANYFVLYKTPIYYPFNK